MDRAVVKAFTRNQATLLVAKTARQIEEAAKRQAKVRKPNENNRSGGRLRASIGTKIGGSTFVVTARIGSRLNYAEPAHQGAKRHIIRPRRKQFLSFKWTKGEKYAVPVTKRGMVQFKSVNHPGMKGTQFLVNPLRKYGRRNGFRVTFVRRVR